MHSRDAEVTGGAGDAVAESRATVELPADGTESGESFREAFEARGFTGPVSILSPAEAAAIARQLKHAPAAEWKKGHAAASPDYYAVATHPEILERVSAILGENVMLWGASLVVRKPGRVHAWHTDLETAEGVGRTVTVWLGLEHVNRNSALQVIPYSHRFGMSIQELRKKVGGLGRRDVPVEEVLAWAMEREPRAEVRYFDMGDGDAIFFDGRLWHGTHNTNTDGERSALLLQYATPDRPIRIPDYSNVDWPFQFSEEPLPPCIMVRGTDTHGVNRMVPPPSRPGTGSSWVRQLDLPLAADHETGWQAHRIFAGATPCLPRLTCHASVLSPGRTPHEPHEHADEEILIVLSGEATLVIGENGSARMEAATAGTFVCYPAGQSHTLRNESDAPVTYLMFKWRSGHRGAGGQGGQAGPGVQSGPGERRVVESGRLGMLLRRASDVVRDETPERAPGRKVERLVDGPTKHLRKLRAHVSELLPGAGYDPHTDAYDVALLVLRGTIETLDQRVGPNGVVFYAAGEPHGLRNVGDGRATYLVFEFHGAGGAGLGESGRSAFPILSRLAPVLPARARKAARKRVASLRRRLWPDSSG